MVYDLILPASSCAIDAKLSLENIFCIIQDAVTTMFKKMHCDNVTLTTQYDIMTVFAKHKAKILNRPMWNEKIKINSRIVKKTKITFYIKTEIFDSTNKLCIESIIEACCLNKNNFRISPIQTIPFICEEEEIDTKFVFENTEMKFVKEFKVMPYLCDMLMHMNNAKALFPLAETLELDDINEIYSHPFELAVKYSAQALLGSKIQMFKEKTSNGLTFKYVGESENLLEQGYIKYL